ncbi:MAG: hypothetical protein ACREJT_12490 [Myxococcota bacterium]
MHPNPALRTILLTLLCVAVFVVRAGGAHLHLCFDGQEPPASLHVLDIDIHEAGADANADAGMSLPHEDLDVALAEQTLSKYKPALDLPLFLLAALALLLLAQPRRRAPVVRTAVARALAPLFLRPPPRGPPLLLSR